MHSVVLVSDQDGLPMRVNDLFDGKFVYINAYIQKVPFNMLWHFEGPTSSYPPGQWNLPGSRATARP